MDTLQRLTSIRVELAHTQSRDSLHALATDLLAVAEDMVDASQVGPDRLNDIAGSLASIRYLLGELGRLEGSSPTAEARRKIAERYRGLEGKVKELRNDRCVNVCSGPTTGK
jgi:hypothetical protein